MKLLRVHGLRLDPIPMENQDGPLVRYKMAMEVEDLSQDPLVRVILPIDLVFDDLQLALLRDLLLRSEFPEISVCTPPTPVQ